MVKNIKFVFATALALTLVACGGNVPAHNHGGMFYETATDLLNNSGIAFEAKKIGGVDAVDVSSTYAQYGVDKEGNYCLRFATAVRGDITDITYTRKGIEGVADGLDKVINISGILNLPPVVSDLGGLVVFGLVILSLLKFSVWKKRA